MKAVPGKVNIQRVKEVFHDVSGGYTFPMKTLRDQLTRQLTAPSKDMLTLTNSDSDKKAGGPTIPQLDIHNPGGPAAPQHSVASKGDSLPSNAPLSVVQAIQGQPHDSGEPYDVDIDTKDNIAKRDFTVCNLEPGDVQFLPDGNTIAFGRNTQKHKSSPRPPHVWREVWQLMGVKQTRDANRAWTVYAAANGIDEKGSALTQC